jgi:uncharacterized membrane protein
MPSPAAVGATTIAALSLLYPAIVYGSRAFLPPHAFVALALLLVGLRVATLQSEVARTWRTPLIGTGLVVGGTAAVCDGGLAAKIYPVALSLAAALTFGISLLQPPSLIERFARSREPELSPAGQAYCRAVTIVWTVWLTANGAVAALLAVAGSEGAWALWTGLLAYLVMGGLIGGEIVVRRLMRPRSVHA